MENECGSEVTSIIAPTVQKRPPYGGLLTHFTTIYCIDCEKFHNGSDGVPSFTLDQNSSSSERESWLYQKHKLLDPIPDYTTSFKKTTKLNLHQQQEIISQHATGQSLRELAKTFGVSYETIRTTIKRHQQETQSNSNGLLEPETKEGSNV